MTQADTAHAVRRSLDSKPTRGLERASIKDPLPDGWAAFCSKPDRTRGEVGHWYATAPYLAFKVGGDGNRCPLAQTVDAETWWDLHVKVQCEVETYRRLTGKE